MVALIGCFVDEIMFSSSILVSFLYAVMILNYDHAHNRHTRVEGKYGLGV